MTGCNMQKKKVKYQTKWSIKACKYSFLGVVEEGLTIRPHVFIHITIYVFHSNASREKTSGMANPSLAAFSANCQAGCIHCIYQWHLVIRPVVILSTSSRRKTPRSCLASGSMLEGTASSSLGGQWTSHSPLVNGEMPHCPKLSQSGTCSPWTGLARVVAPAFHVRHREMSLGDRCCMAQDMAQDSICGYGSAYRDVGTPLPWHGYCCPVTNDVTATSPYFGEVKSCLIHIDKDVMGCVCFQIHYSLHSKRHSE